MSALRRYVPVAVFAGLALSAAGAGTLADRSFPVSGAKVLQIESGEGDVILVSIAAATPDVRVRITQNGGSAQPQVRSSRAGDRLILAIAGTGGQSVVPFAASSPASFSISYPARMRVDLRVSSGNVRVEHPVSAVELYAQDGDVTIDAPRAVVTAQSGSGSITVNHALAAVDLAADDGDVTAGVDPGWSKGEIRVQSASGSIRLALPAGFRGRFDTSSTPGGLHNAFGKSNARSPLVWLYAPAGSIWITAASQK